MSSATGMPREVQAIGPDVFAMMTAELIANAIRVAVTARSKCRIVLAGGRTPAAVYRELAADTTVPWEKVSVFIGDERCVPPDHAESNYRMINETLLSAVNLEEDRIFRIRGELGGVAAAAEYDAMLDALSGEPKFDIVISGVGADGHTASLFPGDPRIDTVPGWAMSAVAPAPFAVSDRAGLTFRALNSTRLQLVLCTAADKRAVRDRILRDAAPELPAARLSGVERTLWIVEP